MIDDGTLLRSFVKDQSQAAFSELIRRHVNLVYSVAVRELRGDSHRANDVVQKVFTDLIRKASSLWARRSLTGWLHISARHSAAEMLRADFRRQKREAAATLVEDANRSEDHRNALDWDRVRSALNEVVDELSTADREAVLMRFFERSSFADIAYVLRSTEDTAQKRVTRALAKLREKLAARGIASSAVALSALLETHAISAAPAGLAASVLSSTTLGIATAGTSAVVPFIFMNAFKTGLAVAVGTVALGGWVWQYRENRTLTQEMAGLEHEQARVATLRAELAHLAASREQSDSELVRLRADLAASQAPSESTRVGAAVVPEAGGTTRSDRSTASSDRTTPTATQKVVREAIAGGDPRALLEAITLVPQGLVLAHDAYFNLSSEQRARYASPEAMMAELLCATTVSTTGTQALLSEELAGAHGMGPDLQNDPRFRTLHTRTVDSTGRTRDSYQVFQQSPEGWRWVVSQGLVVKRLAEAGLITPPAPAK